MNEFQRRIGVGQRQYLYGRYLGTTRTSPVVDDQRGRLAGSTTEHWSGRLDSTVMPEPVHLQGRLHRDGTPDYTTVTPKEQ